ncbi:GerAB/ArcD/ProY family transporter [Bacillaceae bacterium SIJ1]|uniref:GerAB/ArcD/ProY family transporter n=1 Tax=Litoribacterium kuwaitense TaxID=1398745 RepID=UPI0013EB8685|nr:GerAB/ArcD/ProY family transporter [Litoribacterium kuwaitense]NGP43930.1 GerAB/ArcD/ProY family transporter [Litoribacterium kuwaitense]
MTSHIKKQFRVSPFFVLFLVHGAQTGIFILNFQHSLVPYVGYDAWLSLLLAAGLSHIIIALIYVAMKRSGGSIDRLHDRIFGRVLGRALLMLLSIGYFVGAFLILRTYIQIIQTWVFPDMIIWLFALVLLLLVGYIVAGGFRVVTGITVYSVFIPSFLLFVVFFPMQYAQYSPLLPVFTSSVTNIWQAALGMMPAFFGYLFIIFYYPFINEPEKSQKWAHLANLISFALYVVTAFVSFSFFSPNQLMDHIWPTLSLLQVVTLPFVERFEIITIAFWLLILLPYTCLAIWAGTKMLKRLTGARQRTYVWIVIAGIYISLLLITQPEKLNMFADFYRAYGVVVLFIYVPVLALGALFKGEGRKRNET